jgi:hypothetical protein
MLKAVSATDRGDGLFAVCVSAPGGHGNKAKPWALRLSGQRVRHRLAWTTI